MKEFLDFIHLLKEAGKKEGWKIKRGGLADFFGQRHTSNLFIFGYHPNRISDDKLEMIKEGGTDMKTRVLTDSASGISAAEAREYGLLWLPLQIFVDGVHHLDGFEIDNAMLLDWLRQGRRISTSQPPVDWIEKVLEQAKQEGTEEILAINLAQSMSSTSKVIQAVGQRLGISILPLETCAAQAIERDLALQAARMASQGKSALQIIAALEPRLAKSDSYVILSDPDHIQNGGWFGGFSHAFHTMWKWRPIIRIGRPSQGQASLIARKRRVNQGVEAILDHLALELDIPGHYLFYIAHVNNLELARQVARQVRERFGHSITVEIVTMCPVVTCHTGPGAVAVQVMEKI